MPSTPTKMTNELNGILSCIQEQFLLDIRLSAIEGTQRIGISQLTVNWNLYIPWIGQTEIFLNYWHDKNYGATI
jgi:hypothetical protein